MRAEAWRILVVDDEAPVRLTVSEVLRRAGYRVLAAEDGAAALSQLAREPVDLVLLDLLMPGLSGWDLLWRLRQQQPGVSVIVFSGTSPEPGAATRLEALGIDFVSKTSAPHEVLEHVAAALPHQLVPV